MSKSTTAYSISMNKNMETILSRLKVECNNPTMYSLSPNLSQYIKTGIELRKEVNCYTYKSTRNFELFYEDRTGNEYTNNKLYVANSRNTKETLKESVAFCFAIANILASFPDKFNVVLSISGEEFIVSFYCVRDSEQWLAEDLDSYLDEAIIVITIN